MEEAKVARKNLQEAKLLEYDGLGRYGQNIFLLK